MPGPTVAYAHPRLEALVAQARARHAGPAAAPPPAVAIVHPCDAMAMSAAQSIVAAGIARPILVGHEPSILKAASSCGVDLRDFDVIATPEGGIAAAERAVELARQGAVAALMKGSLHTDELMAPVVRREGGLRGARRISHAFLFDIPGYHKLLALADCVVNIAPNLATKQDILANALDLLRTLGVQQPKAGIVAAVESVNPQIPATLDAQALVEMAGRGAFGPAIVEGPFGFDNAYSAQAARIKGINSRVSGDADLLLMPDLNAGNMLYKSFNYVGGADSAGLVLGAQVPIILTSRADSVVSRVASVALAVLAAPH